MCQGDRCCQAVHESGKKCLLVRHGDDVQHCTLNPHGGGWLFWGGREPAAKERAMAKLASMSDAEAAELWKRIEGIEEADRDYWENIKKGPAHGG